MAADQTSEQELQFKKRARRRLVGAIALVLLMVTILPMVLDDRSSTAPKQEIAIHIPSQDGEEFTSKVAPVTEPTEEIISGPILTAPVEQEGDADPEAEPAAPKSVVPSPAAPKVETKAEPAKPATEPVKEVVKKETPKPEPKPAAPKAEAHKADTAKAEAAKAESRKAESAKPEASAKSTAGGFLVQIGVFSDPINVKNLQDKLSGQGLKSHTEVIATAAGEKTRLRVGPFASRDQADQALGKVKAAGLSGMVISNK